MNCFRHQTHVAVGTCYSCGKGLCNECVTDLGHAIVCKGVHEEKAEALNLLLSRQTKVTSTGRKARWVMPLLFSLIGISCIAEVVYTKEDDIFLMAYGAIMLIFGLIIHFYNRKALR